MSCMSRLTPALVRALDILELFIEGRDRLTAAEVTDLTGFPRSSVHELLTTMDAHDYLDKDDSGTYSLGVSALRLGNAYASRFDLVGTATEIARNTATRAGETCSVAVLDDDQVFYLAKAEGAENVVTISAIGRRLPAHCTGLGKAMLAWMPESERLGLLPGVLTGLTPNSITDHDRLAEDLALTKARGYALEREESQFNAACAAAPVRDVSGEVVAAISLSVPLNRWDQRPIEHWGALILAAAARFSARLGYREASSEMDRVS